MKKSQNEIFNTVVITGADHPTGLNTARALADIGFRIVGFCSNLSSPCCHSKVWDQLVETEYLCDTFVEELIQLAKKLSGRKVIFPSQDKVAQIISDSRNDLSQYYEIVLPEKKVFNMLMDKTLFHEWASENKFLVPESYIIDNLDSLYSILESIQYPVILKPYVKTVEWDKASPIDKAYKLYRKEDIKKIGFDIFKASSKIIIQQWIPGGDSNVYFCLSYFDRRSKELAYFTGKKIFQWPAGTGSTAAAISIDNDEIHKVSKRLFEQAGFRGLGSVEFKKHDNDKKYYIIEPTVGRNDLQSSIAIAGGINLSKIALFDVLNTQYALNKINQKKVVWIADSILIDLMKYYIRNPGEFRIWDFLQLLIGKKKFTLFDFKDPKPAFELLVKKIKTKLKNLTIN